MIDWLEEVLRGAGSGEEQSELPELLRHGGAAPLNRRAAAGEPEGFDLPAEQVRQGGDRPLSGVTGMDREAMALTAEAVGDRGGSVLQSLYRRMVETVGGFPVMRGSAVPGSVQEEQVAVAAGLTVRELDRALCRDSRRYDGGMSIY